MKVSLYQQINSNNPSVYSKEYKIERDLDFIPDTFWPSTFVESKVLSSSYEIEMDEMIILLEPFDPEDFEDMCSELEKIGWKET
jgi:hypothetical protein